MRKLIITADDFGLSLAVSKGIIQSIKEGLVTETCAMVNSPYFMSSVELAKQNGIEKMGVHLTATCLMPLEKTLSRSVFVDKNGRFSKQWLSMNLSDADIALLEKEFSCQIDTFLATGLHLTHINSHHGLTNVDSRIKVLFEKLSRQYNVPVRLEQFDQLVMLDSRQSSEHILQKLKESRGEYVELCTHPGYVDEPLAQVSSLLERREQDLVLLIDKKFKQQVESNFELITFDWVKEVSSCLN